MSPEPIQEPIEANLNVNPDDGIDIPVNNESDSEDDDIQMAGYLPLSQIPIEGEPLEEDDEDEDFEWNDSEPSSSQQIVSSNGDLSIHPEVEVWSSPCNATNIDLDADKIDQVKSAMASFTLPSTAIPEWANLISEDQWKQQLIHRIKEIQKDKNENA